MTFDSAANDYAIEIVDVAAPRLTAILYVSYDGMLEPLGQSQVLAYLELLAADYRIYLISFEKPADMANETRLSALRQRVEAAQISWTSLTYHKWPSVLVTAWDIVAGASSALFLVRRHEIAIVHARSYVPALMAMFACRFSRAKFIFDIRGFWVDERVDGGLWRADSWLYRFAKAVEKAMFRAADHVVTLTEASAREIERFPYLLKRTPQITVIPTCTDVQKFSPPDLKSESGFVMGYLGSVGTWYLFDKALECFKALREIRPDARMSIVNRSDHGLIYEALNRAGIDPSDVDLRAADYSDVPQFIRGMSAGVALTKPAYSKLASAPTKVAEYLSCGAPCLANGGVGDLTEILEGEGVGVVLTDFSADTVADGMKRLVQLVQNPETPGKCRAVAKRLFSIEIGADRYRRIYEQLAQAS